MRSRITEQLFTCLNSILKWKNLKRKKILIYTDSRGYNVISKWGKNPFESYILRLCFNYRTDYFICKEKFTTIVDFLILYDRIRLNKYDAVILHCGIVDFSPRPLSNISKVKESKVLSQRFNDLFLKNEIHYQSNLGNLYAGEETNTLYSIEYLMEEIIPKLCEIPNLIWINSNHFVKGWEGNYVKGRPENIDQIVSSFDHVLEESLNNKINLKTWSDADIKMYTIDNIHFTKKGFIKLGDELLNLLAVVFSKENRSEFRN